MLSQEGVLESLGSLKGLPVLGIGIGFLMLICTTFGYQGWFYQAGVIRIIVVMTI